MQVKVELNQNPNGGSDFEEESWVGKCREFARKSRVKIVWWNKRRGGSVGSTIVNFYMRKRKQKRIGRVVGWCLEASHGLPWFTLPFLFSISLTYTILCNTTLSAFSRTHWDWSSAFIILAVKSQHTSVQSQSWVPFPCGAPAFTFLPNSPTPYSKTLSFSHSFIHSVPWKWGKEFIWASIVADPMLPVPGTFSILLCVA